MEDETEEKIEEQEESTDLKPYLFKPGQSGNPSGRPKGRKNLTTLLKDALYERAVHPISGKPILVEGKEVRWADLLIKQTLYKGVVRGQKEIHQMIYDRIEGKSMARIQLSDDTEKGEEFDAIKAMLSEIKEMQDELKKGETTSTQEKPVEEAGS